MKNQKKFFLGILLSLTLMIGMMPALSQKAHADTTYSDYVVSNSDTSETLPDKVVKFNNNDWYIIADDSTAANAGTVTLLAKNVMSETKKFGNSNFYSQSEVKSYLESLTGKDGSFEDVSHTIVPVDLTTKKYNSDETYDTVTGAKLWLLSTEEVTTIYNNLSDAAKSCTTSWWLRSPGEGEGYAATMSGTSVTSRIHVSSQLGVRPALKLDLSKVTFDSTGKTFEPIIEYPLWIGKTQVTSANKSGKNWSYNPDKKILTLHGLGFGSGEYYDGVATVDYGIRCGISGLTIDVTTDSTVEASGTKTYSYGIWAPKCKLRITGDGTLTAKGGSDSTGEGSYGYTGGIKADTVDVIGKLEAVGGKSSKGEHYSHGIGAGAVNVYGELIATGDGYGIYGSIDGVIIEKGSKATIVGGKSCVKDGTVNNYILGTGWTNTEGTEDAALIKVGNAGNDLSKFKKALFPTEADPATVDTKPTAKNLTYNGKAQALVAAGKASGGTMQYAIGKDKKTAPATGWGKSIPKGTKTGTYYVWYKAAGDDSHIDSDPGFVTSTIKSAPAKVSGTLVAKMTAKANTGLNISWIKIQGVSGYDIFFSKCNIKGKEVACKKVKTINGNKTFKWTKTSLKKGTSYKAYVKAFTLKNGKKSYVRTSPMMHAYTGNVKGKFTNAKSVTIKNVKKGKLSLKKGKTFKIKAKVNKVKKNKKLMPKKHVKTVRYITSNKKVATVSAAGKITAKGKGSCAVYAIAHNGMSRSIKVTVK